MAEKPTAAMVLGLIGGIFILIGGLVFILIGSVVGAIMAGTQGAGAQNLIYALGGLGILSGLLVIVGSVMLYTKPEKHAMWGAIVLVFSLISLVTSGGFFIGFILALIGGILGIIFKPAPAMGAPGAWAPMAQPTGGMHCPKCGAAAPMGASNCPNCGAKL